MTSETVTLYRQAVRDVCLDAPSDDDGFKRYLHERYQEAVTHLSQLENSDAGAPQNVRAARNELFVLATGIFAFGDLDAAYRLLESIPPTGEVRMLVGAVAALLPLPSDIDPLADPDTARRWIDAHASRLRWDEQSGWRIA